MALLKKLGYAAVAVPYALLLGLSDSLTVIAFTMADLTQCCFNAECWPWEVEGGLEIEEKEDH